MSQFDGVLNRIGRLRDALATTGDEAALKKARQEAQSCLEDLASQVESLSRTVDRGSMDAAEKKSLEAQLAALETSSAARVRALEEEVDALLSPGRAEVARSLYQGRIGELSTSLAAAREQRERLEKLLRGNGEPRSEIDLARDGVMIQAALARENELATRLAEAEARLARLSAS